MQVKEAADPREMRSRACKSCFWDSSLCSRAKDDFSTERKSMLMTFTVGMMLGGISPA